MSVLHLACAARRDYVPHSAAMIHSVLGRRGALDVRVHFMHGEDLPEEDRGALRDMVRRGGGEIAFLAVGDERIAGLRTHEWLPASHWYRVLLPELLPDVDTVLYLDGDTIAVDALEPLWATDLGDHPLAAVTNVFQPDHLHRIEELGLPGPEAYFNSGVMLMNLALMRREDATGAVLAWARENHARMRWPEQDALNVVLGARRLRLHPRWNAMNAVLDFPWAAEALGAEAVQEARLDPAIRHFEGPPPNKPWHYLFEHGSREVYLAHRRETPWPRVRLEGRTPRNVWSRVRGRRGAPA